MHELRIEHEIFVGREKELAEINRVMDSQIGGAIYIYGNGGIGKTRILRKIKEMAIARNYIVSDIIDFDEISNHNELTVLYRIATYFGADRFRSFLQTIENYESINRLEKYELKIKAIEDFISSLRSLSKDRKVIILFDTLDRARHTHVYNWLLKEFLPKVKEQATIFIAGRNPLDDQEWTLSLLIKRFNENNSIEYTSKKFESLSIEYKMDLEDLRKIHELSEGRPIIFSLAIDWIIENAKPKELSSLQKKDFKNKITTSFTKDSMENKMIRHMSVIDRRFESNILSHLAERSIEECENILKEISRFSFIKYKPFSKSYTLHDEMKLLLNEYASIPPDSTKELLSKIIDYYSELIAKLEDEEVIEYMLLDKLNYMLRFDRKEGFEFFKNLSQECMIQEKYDFGWLLLEELQGYTFPDEDADVKDLFKAKLLMGTYKHSDAFDLYNTLYQRYSHRTDKLKETAMCLKGMGACCLLQGELNGAISYFNKSLEIFDKLNLCDEIHELTIMIGNTYFKMGKYNKAITNFDRIVESKDCNTRLVAKSLELLGETYRRQGQHDLAMKIANKCRIIRKDASPRDIARSYNLLGKITRDNVQFEQKRFDMGLKYFKKALQIFKDEGDFLGQAQVYTQIAWLEFLRGENLAKSEKLTRQALKIKNENGFNWEIATDYHTLSHLCEKQNKYDEAREHIQNTYELAWRYLNGFMIADALTHFATYDCRECTYNSIDKYLTEMEDLNRKGFSYPLFKGRLLNFSGDGDVENDNYLSAIEKYVEGYFLMGSQVLGSGGLHHFRKEIALLESRIAKFPPNEKAVLCKKLFDKFTDINIINKFPELVNVLERK